MRGLADDGGDSPITDPPRDFGTSGQNNVLLGSGPMATSVPR